MKPIIIHHRSSHHASYSGYDLLRHYVDADCISGVQSTIPYSVAKYISNLVNQKAGIYNSSSVYKDIKLFKKLLNSNEKFNAIHYLNAERDLRFVFRMKYLIKNKKICATFHKPPEVLSNEISDNKILKKLDGAIAVGINQVEYLKDWLGINHVEYIPHGVDTNFFVPDITNKKTNTILFVGQHLRDFDAFNFCIPKIASRIKNLKVNVVLREDFRKKIKSHPSIKFHSNINDFELKYFYQEANLLFLPLLDSTACNSLLEAMACGLPIITTDVGGNAEYLANTKNILSPKNDNDSLIETTISLLKDDAVLLNMGKLSREKALDYRWEIIGDKLKSFYNVLTSF